MLAVFLHKTTTFVGSMRVLVYLRVHQQLRHAQGNPAMTIRVAVNPHFTQMGNMNTQTTPHRAENPFLRGTAELKGCV